ncbi:MAG: serpin family protein [Bacteroidales bacterium]|nr:serpin family protein [Bacteroidales bacterium]
MKRPFWKSTAVVISLFLLFSCNGLEQEGGKDDGNNPYSPIALTTKQTEFVTAGNSFAGRFIDKIDENALKQKQNEWIVSPLSLQLALGMLLNGAQGETAAEICRTLGYGEGETAEINAWAKLMLEQLPKLDKKTDLALADAIFYNKTMTLKTPYKDAVGTSYKATLEALDFTKTKASADVINKWCDKQTKGLIPHVLNEVDPSYLAYLVNALYFKSQWQKKFPKSASGNETFYQEDGSKGKVKMMKQDGQKFQYGETEIWQAIRLPYGNGNFAMTVVLPKEGHTVREISAAMGKGVSVYTVWDVEADLWIPRFETQYHIGLNDILKDLGMPQSFTPKADFKAMSDYASFVGFVQQDAVIKVDEEGTEAAAVTVIGMLTAAAPIAPPQKVVFHADHPFLYLITESSTGTILFAGKYSGK